MNQRQILYLDYDCMLVNFEDPFAYWISLKYNIPKPSPLDWKNYSTPRDVYGDGVSEFWRNPDLYNLMVRPYPESKAFLESLKALDAYDIRIATDTEQKSIEYKAEHIRDHFGDIPVVFTEPNDGKSVTIDGILVDDHPNNVYAHYRRSAYYEFMFNYKSQLGWAHHSAARVPVCRTHSELYILLKQIAARGRFTK